MQKRKTEKKENYGYKKKEIWKNREWKKTFYKSTSKKDTTKNKAGNIVKKRNHENEKTI